MSPPARQSLENFHKLRLSHGTRREKDWIPFQPINESGGPDEGRENLHKLPKHELAEEDAEVRFYEERVVGGEHR